MRILVVEDEPKLARLLAAGLDGAGFTVDLVNNGLDALDRAARPGHRCVVLDIGLPKLDGLEVVRRLRTSGVHTPVVLLTARDDVADRVRGLEAGADDYCVKPVDLAELVARVRAQVRRHEEFRAAAVHAGDIDVDPVEHAVAGPEGRVPLSPTEFALLLRLAERPGELCTRADLLDHVWGRSPDRAPNVLEVYVGYVRAKLGAVGARSGIRTVRGSGYVLDVTR